ncbi:MAG: hypothetical protein H6Q69_411 [Firmicutes bacterium]|nr:hypothetical protein [Bacillota bacterium]
MINQVFIRSLELEPLDINIKKDIDDQLEVFLYTNLSRIVSPNPSVLLTPEFHASLLAALNGVGIRHDPLLPKDLKDILDVFIIINANIISTDTIEEINDFRVSPVPPRTRPRT